MSNLIVIDDHEIRKTAFARVDRLLKKLRRLETGLADFNEQDQVRYNEWLELTFRHERAAIEMLRAEYATLVEFHNRMNALAEMDDLSLPEAAYQLRMEEIIYARGTPEQRMKIDEARRLRDAYVRAEADRSEQRYARQRARERDEERQTAEEIEQVKSLNDEELEEVLADPSDAFELLGKTLKVAVTSGDYKLFLRLWDSIHPQIQHQFAKDFKRKSRLSLFDVVATMRRNSMEPDEKVEEAEEAPPEKVETFKLIYRQLARLLHPDMQVGQAEDAGWRHQMWLRVQGAYKNQDDSLLNKLSHMVLLRTRKLNDLRVSDLHMTHKWISEEIGALEKEFRRLRQLPAWKFSRRKDMSKVAEKIGRQMKKEHLYIEDKVLELRKRHAFLERMGRDMASTPRGRKRSEKSNFYSDEESDRESDRRATSPR